MVYRIGTKAKLRAEILLFDYKDIVRKNLMRIFVKKEKEVNYRFTSFLT